MVYPARAEALRWRFGQETDTSIALQELAGLKRGRNQSAKELADSARRLASRAYYSRKGEAPRIPDGGRRGASAEVCRARMHDPGDGGGDRGNTGTIYKKSCAVCAS